MLLSITVYTLRDLATHSHSPAIPLLMPRKSSYRRKIHAYAASEVWAARSRRFRTQAGFRCRSCGLVDKRNHAHHLSYARAFSGKEPDSDLMCLCGPCHRLAHAYARSNPSLTLRVATFKSLGIRRTLRERLTA